MAIIPGVSEGSEDSVEALRATLGRDAYVIWRKLQEFVYAVDRAEGTPVVELPVDEGVLDALAVILGDVRAREISVDRGLDVGGLGEELRKYAASKGFAHVGKDCVEALLSEPFSDV